MLSLPEFLAKIGDDTFECSGVESLGFDCLEVFVVLADVGAEGDDIEALFAEPFEDDGGVESAGVGEDYFGVGFAGHDDDDMIVLSTEVIMRALVID